MQPRMGRHLFAAISARNAEVGPIEHTCCAAAVTEQACFASSRPRAAPSQRHYFIDELRLSSPARPANALCRRCTSRRTAALRPTSPSTGGCRASFLWKTNGHRRDAETDTDNVYSKCRYSNKFAGLTILLSCMHIISCRSPRRLWSFTRLGCKYNKV
jgi:hypothetical protein